MKPPVTAITLKPGQIAFTFENLIEHLNGIPGGSKLLEQAESIFYAMEESWAPGAVLIAMEIDRRTADETRLSAIETGAAVLLNLGCSARFLEPARIVIAGAYTAGSEIEKAAACAVKEQRYLDSYIIEQAGLALLGKTAETVNGEIEKIAADLSWGVGPLLSPGSIHGWNLSDQPVLCSCLPIKNIGVVCGENGVLSPFNSLSFLIGIGPEYGEEKVGSPCEVCTNRGKCTLQKQTHE